MRLRATYGDLVEPARLLLAHSTADAVTPVAPKPLNRSR